MWSNFLLHHSFELEAALRILLAIVLSGIIGWERSNKNRPAGFRTYMLVCIGSATVMIVSEYLMIKYEGRADIDPQRLGAQVLSGIGFLGAGTIIKTSDSAVKGLTTAAALWTTSCIGLAIGSGAYVLAIIAALFTFLVTAFFFRLEQCFIYSRSDIVLYIAAKGNNSKLDEVITTLKHVGITYNDIKIEKADECDDWSFYAWLLLRNPKNIAFESIWIMLSHIENVKVYDQDEIPLSPFADSRK